MPALLNTDLDVDDQLATQLLDGMLASQSMIRSPNDFIFLAACRNDLRQTCGLNPAPLPPQCASHMRMLGISPAPMSSNAAKAGMSPLDAASARFPDSFADAMSSPTNVAGNLVGAGLALESLYHSLPPTWRVSLAGAEWELYDANKTARKHAFGKKGKAKFPPRMVLRARNAPLTVPPPNAKLRGTELRIPAHGAKTVSEALKLSRMDRLQPITMQAFEKLKSYRLAGRALGPALAFGPSAIADVHSSGLLDDATNRGNWERFAIASAKSQSSNAVGFGASVIAGAALVGVGVTAAPVVLVVGLVVGIGAQAGFTAFGLDDRARDLIQDLVR